MEDVNVPNFDELIDDVTQPQEPDLNQKPAEDPNQQPGTDPDKKPDSEPDTIDYSDNPLYSFLQTKGIKDPSKISFENEDGTTQEQDFNSLSPEEQLEILQEVTDPGLSEDEINTVNFLRKNRMSMQQVLDTYAKQKLDAYLKDNPDKVHQKSYTIDDYTDDDLYLVNLKRQYPSFTDDELLSKLEEAKKNEELYKKESEALRNTYKAQEDKEAADREQQQKQQLQDLQNTLMNAANEFNEIQLDYTDDNSDSLVVEDSDKQQMMSYLLDQDENGKSQLVKDLENPDALIELAWLRTQGAEVLSSVTKYWKGLLADERVKSKKLEAQIEKMTKKGDDTVIVPPANPKESANGDTGITSAWDNTDLL